MSATADSPEAQAQAQDAQRKPALALADNESAADKSADYGSQIGNNTDTDPSAGEETAKGDVLAATSSGRAAAAIVTPVYESSEHPETERYEVWAWYAYYIGANGLSLFNFGPTAFQNLLSQAAPVDTGLLDFGGHPRNVNSIVLLCNGISFAIQAALFLIIGAYADFGSGRRWVLVFFSLLSYGIGFGWLGVHEPEQWQAGAALYMLGLLCYQLTLTYWTAAFPALARNTRRLKEAAMAYAEGETTQIEYDLADEMERSRLANVSFYIQSVGEVFILAVIVGVMFGVHVNDSTEANNWGLSVLIAVATAFWIALGVPWFFLEKKRPGLKIPDSMNIVTVGLWQLWEAGTQIWRLKQSLIYLVGYFLLGDSLNTTVTVIGTLQNSVVAYDTLSLTYLLIVGIVAQAVGIGGFWLIQKRGGISAKAMFNAVMVGIILLDGWGMIGNWTDKFGFHNAWEFWVYQTFYGLFVCPWYSYSQILISSVTPRGHEFLFFSLFSIIGKTSSFIGPQVSSAIIDASPGGDNNSAPFYFLFALSLVSAVGIWVFLDLEKSAREQEVFLKEEKARLGLASETSDS